MKKLMALLCVLSACLFENVYGSDALTFRHPYAVSSPFGNSKIQGNPGLYPTPLLLGVQSYSIENASYWQIAFTSDFNVSLLRLGSVVEYSALDSLYDRLRMQWNAAYSKERYAFGMGYNLEVSRIIHEGSYSKNEIILGVFFKFPDFLVYSMRWLFMIEDSQSDFALTIHWISNSYSFYAEYERDLRNNIQIGQELLFDAWAVSCAYGYPKSRLYLGFSVWFEKISKIYAFAGVSSVSKYYQGRVIRLEYQKNSR